MMIYLMQLWILFYDNDFHFPCDVFVYGEETDFKKDRPWVYIMLQWGAYDPQVCVFNKSIYRDEQWCLISVEPKISPKVEY